MAGVAIGATFRYLICTRKRANTQKKLCKKSGDDYAQELEDKTSGVYRKPVCQIRTVKKDVVQMGENEETMEDEASSSGEHTRWFKAV